MTNRPEIDQAPILAGKTLPLSLLSSDDEQRAGIRVTRAEFAKMMECSRQAVTDWVQSGRIAVGADGRFDPRQAVTSLLRTGDPSRIRAKVLEPLTRELGAMTHRIGELEEKLQAACARIAGLEAELEAAIEDADFQEGSAIEFCELFGALEDRVTDEWETLHALQPEESKAAILQWLHLALQFGADRAGSFSEVACTAFGGEEGAGSTGPIAAICQQDQTA